MTTQTLTSQPATPSLLKGALTLDAVGAAGMGALLLVANAPLVDLFGLQSDSVFLGLSGSSFLTLLGVILLAIGAWVGWNAARDEVDTRQVQMIIALNTFWVVDSILLLVTNALPLSTMGSWVLLIQADVVLLIVIAEFVGLRRLNKQSRQ